MSESKAVFEGNQFIFIIPEPDRAVEVQLIKESTTGKKVKEELRKVEKATIFPRLGQDVNVKGLQYFSSLSLERYKLLSVVTDKKIYKPGDSVNAFVFSPLDKEKEADLNVLKNGHLIYAEKISLDKWGAHLETLESLDKGQYEITVSLNGNSTSCDFQVAEYSLSFLRGSLISHTLDDENLKFELSVNAGGFPYDGKLTIGLYCDLCGYSVKDLKLEVHKGKASGTFNLANHTGPFSLILSTPGGDSASVYIPRSEAHSRKKIRISEMGDVIEASLFPGKTRQQEVRGFYLSKRGVRSTPVTIDKLVGTSAKIRFEQNFAQAMICIVDPCTGKYRQQEHRNLNKGDTVEIEIAHPFNVLMVGAINEQCYESFCVLIRPDEMDIQVEAPKTAAPGDEVEVKITSSRKGKLMLVVADSRLQRENPGDILCETVFNTIQDNLIELHTGKVEHFQEPMYGPIRDAEPPRSHSTGIMGLAMPAMMLSAAPEPIAVSKMEMGPGEAVFEELIKEQSVGATETTTPAYKALPSKSESLEEFTTTRLEFPEIVTSQLIDFEGSHSEKIKLGEQIGEFTVFAFLVNGHDFKSARSNIKTTQEVYVELDVPSLMSEGDEITGKALASCPGRGEVSIKTSLTSTDRDVDKSAIIEFPVKSAGEVIAEIKSNGKKDVISKTIKRPGKEIITTSELRILEAGEEIESPGIIVLPGTSFMIKDSVKSLIQYPFGCAEQTSAKIYGLGLVYQAIKKNTITNGKDEKRVKFLINQGIERMKLFYDGKLFSLWESGRPDSVVTRKVLKNLVPLKEMNILNLQEMIRTSVGLLLKKKVKDSALLPYSNDFAGEISTVKDAALFYRYKIDTEKSRKFVLQNVAKKGDFVFWNDETCWGKEVEATCYALQVAFHEDRKLFFKGFRFISEKLQNKMLFSTADTAAFLDLLNLINLNTPPRAEIDGKETVVQIPVRCKKIKALEEILVRIDSKKEIDHLIPRSDFEGEVNIERTSLSPGEKTKLSVVPMENSLAPLARIYLPGNLAEVSSGAGVQQMYLPIKGKRLILEVYGVRKGEGELRVVLHDMYDPDKVGVLPGIKVTVS